MELIIKGIAIQIDEEDLERIKSRKWSILHNHGQDRQVYFRHSQNYKREGGRSCRTTFLHRFIIGAQRGQIVDHINCDTLDNRKENLRFVDRFQNARNARMYSTNKTGFKGVSWSEAHKKFRAYIAIEGKNITLGQFDDPIKAHEAYCEASKKYHGEFGRIK